MQDSLGRFWKVKGSDFVCYTINPVNGSAQEKTVPEMVTAGEPATTHNSRVRKNGKRCGGKVVGPKNFRLCEKCAAEVSNG